MPEPPIRVIRLTLVVLAVLAALPGRAAVPLSLGARVFDADSGELLYQETHLGVVAEGELQQLEISADGPDGEELARRSVIIGDTLWQPEINYVETGGAQIYLERRDNRSWYLSRRAGDEARAHKSWPQLGQKVVMADVLGRYLSSHREDILAGRVDRVAVFYLQPGKLRNLKLESESVMTGRGEMLRVVLISPRLFGANERVASFELERDNGRLWRYTGPALCPCAGEYPRQVTVEYTY